MDDEPNEHLIELIRLHEEVEQLRKEREAAEFKAALKRVTDQTSASLDYLYRVGD